MKKENKTILTIAAVAAGVLLLTKKPVSGVGDVADVTDEQAVDGWRIYAWVLFSPTLYEQTYEIFLSDTGNHGWTAVRNLTSFLRSNMPYPYNNMAYESYEVAAYNLVGDYFEIMKGRLDRERAFRSAAAELQAVMIDRR